jgi:hypothetical protein
LKNKQPEHSTINEYIINTVKERKPQTVEQLLQLVQPKYPMPPQEIMEHIIHLQNAGKLTFREHQTTLPSTPKDYMLSMHATWYWLIIALAIATTTAVFTIPEEAFPIVYARYVLGFIFVLLLPGYSLIKALFPTKELDNIERIGLSIGMSLALVPITGLLLNYTPWGIRTTPITLSLLALTITLATTALIREHQTKIQQNT